MLIILWGLAGSGKSHTLLRTLSERAGQGERRYLLVPEQFSHEQERALCKHGGPRVSQNIEALTFRRLAERILAETGGLAASLLDEGGRLLILRRALDAVQDQLRVWHAAARRPDFWPSLLQTIDECKMYRVSPEALVLAERAAPIQAEGALHDLRLVLTAYESLLGQSVRTSQPAADPRDMLTRSADAVDRSSYGQRGVTWFVDGFSRFTVQESDMLARLLSLSSNMTLALTGLPEGEDDGLFAVSRRTAGLLTRLASRCGVPTAQRILCGAPRYQNPALVHLSQHFLRNEQPFSGLAAGVETVRLEDMRAECAYAAARVRSLTRDEGYRYRDIAVVARDFDAYATLFEQEAARLELPLFWDKKDDVLQKPLFAFVSAALETVSRGYPHDALFRMLKTGLFGLPLDGIDRLENYALAHNLRRGAWRASDDWALPPRGYGRPPIPEDEEELRLFNALRRQVTKPLEALRRRAAACATVTGQARALYDFLEETGLPERLSARCVALTEAGELQRADQTRQMWNILCHALDQCVALIGDSTCNLPEFSETLTLLLTQTDVGSIPVSLDRLSCGDADRIRRRTLRCVILMGATGAALPKPPPPPGLLGWEEREFLREYGLELAPGADERMAQELDIIYGAFTLPSDRLIVTWPMRGGEGEENHPSFAVTVLQKMLGLDTAPPGELENIRVNAADPCLEWLSGRPSGPLALAARAAIYEFPELRNKLHELESFQPTERGQLTANDVNALYGKEYNFSPSRIETYMSCPYAYFLKYGIRAVPRTNTSFSALDRGRFIHDVLEKTLRAVMRQGGFAAVSDEQAILLGRRAAYDYVRDTLRGHQGQTARFKRLFARLEQTVDVVVTNVMTEMRRSDFFPLDMELRFADGVEDALPALPAGQSSRVTGVADRVDGWIDGDTLYVRVVDYKTGKRVCRLSDLYHGLGLQMFLYLFALENEGLSRYGHKGINRILPAGVLYLPAREAFLPLGPDSTDDEIKRAMSNELRRDGLILDDRAVIKAMERGIEGKAEFIPVQFKRNTEELSVLSSAANLERFGRLRGHIDKLLCGMEAALQSGETAARPACRGLTSACETCGYRPACQFDEHAGDRNRRLSAMSNEDFWRCLEEDI